MTDYSGTKTDYVEIAGSDTGRARSRSRPKPGF